jgi:hypothetical protein
VSAGNLPGTGFGITDRLLMEYVRRGLSAHFLVFTFLFVPPGWRGTLH